MKKQIEITTKATKIIEVEIPSYYNFHGKYTAITEHAVISVWSDGQLITCTLESNKERYNEAIDNTLTYSSTVKVSRKEFERAFNDTIKCLTEQYQLSMSMIDPNTQTAEGQEVAATESAAQDTAMEVSAEEGSTEG
jgi:hypothetical protein